MCAAILNIGNIKLEAKADDTVEVSPAAVAAQKEAESLLGVGDLGKLLVEKVVHSPRSKSEYHIALDLNSATNQRDALVKHIYTMLFNLIVARVNLNIEVEKDFHKFIGLLDVFGFEVFQTNSFEQLCINYANERLHNFFLMRVFEVEIELYRMQNLQVPALNYPDNAKVIELLEKSPTGIFPLLDAQCKMPKGSDKGFAATAQKTHAGHPGFSTLSASPLKIKGGPSDDIAFVISHFAGDVCYTCTNFLEKNVDQLSAQFETELKESKQPIVVQMVTLHSGKPLNLGGSATPRKTKTSGQMSARGGTARGDKKEKPSAAEQKGSVGKKFLVNLKQLMREIATTHPYFIRCIKPNSNLAPVEFNVSMVLGQLEKSGTIECVKLMQEGYPSRAPYEDLTHRFKDALPDFMLAMEAQDFVQLLLLACNCQSGDYQLGQDMVFFRANKGGVLQELMMMRKDDVAQKIVENARNTGLANGDPQMATFLEKLEGFVAARKEARRQAMEIFVGTVVATLGLFKWVKWGEKRAILDDKAAKKVQAIQRGKLARIHVENKRRQAREKKQAEEAAIAAAKAAEEAAKRAEESAGAEAQEALEAAKRAQAAAEAAAKEAQAATQAMVDAERAEAQASKVADAVNAEATARANADRKKLDLSLEQDDDLDDEAHDKWFKMVGNQEYHRFLMCKGVEWGFQYHNFYGDWELADADPICHARPHYVHNTMYGGYAHLFHTMDPHYNVPRWVIGPAPGNENGWAFCESDTDRPNKAQTTWISWDGFEWHSCKTFRFVPKEHELDGLSDEEDFIDDDEDIDPDFLATLEGGDEGGDEKKVVKMSSSEYDAQLTARQNNVESRAPPAAPEPQGDAEEEPAAPSSSDEGGGGAKDKKGKKEKKGGLFKKKKK